MAALPSSSNSVTALPVATALENARRSVISEGHTGKPYSESTLRVSAISGERKGQAESTSTAFFFDARTISTALLTAARSKAVGRHGITTKSTAFAIFAASGAVCGAVSTMARLIPSWSAAWRTFYRSLAAAVATIGDSLWRVSPHTVADFWGSVSIRTTRSPDSWAATAA